MNCVKRIALMVIRNILLVPFMWCKLCYYAAHVDKYPEITRYKLLKYIVKRANKGGNVTIEAYGKENIPNEGGFMFFPNHQGLPASIFCGGKKRSGKCSTSQADI